jgi:Zn-dependent protease with chaperone function
MDNIGPTVFNCNLSGQEVSMIGTKKIIFNFDSGNVTLKDEGGIFKSAFLKSFLLNQFRISSIARQINGFKVTFKIDNYDGDFLAPDIALIKELSKYAFSSSSDSIPVTYEYQLVSGRNSQPTAAAQTNPLISFTGMIFKQNNKLVFYSGISKLISFDLSAISNITERDSSIYIDVPFMLGDSYLSGILVKNVTKSNFEDLLKHSFQSADASLNSNGIVAKITGHYWGRKLDGYFCFYLTEQAVCIKSVYKESSYDDIKIDVPFENISHARILANYMVINSRDGILLFESDASSLSKVFDNSYELQKLDYKNTEMNYIGEGLILIKEGTHSKEACCGTLRNNKLVIHGTSEDLEINFDNSSISYMKRFSINDYQIRIMSQGYLHDFICSEAVKYLFESLLIKSGKQTHSICPDDFTHPAEHKSLHKIQKLIIGEKAILDNHDLVKERLSIPDLSGKTVMVTERQFPEIYKIINEAAYLLNIPAPATYIFDSYFYNVDSEGYKTPRLEISSRTVADFSEEELKFLIGSKMAHIACGHLKYEVIIEGMLEVIPKIDSVPLIGNFISMLPATQAVEMYYKINFFDWYRNSILSADRFGLLFCQSLESSVRALLKLILNNQELVDSVNLQDYLGQRENINTLLGIVAFYTKSDEAVPYGQERIINLFDFTHQNYYGLLREKAEYFLNKQFAQ